MHSLRLRYTSFRLYILITLTCAVVSLLVQFLSDASSRIEAYSGQVLEETVQKAVKKEVQAVVNQHPRS